MSERFDQKTTFSVGYRTTEVRKIEVAQIAKSSSDQSRLGSGQKANRRSLQNRMPTCIFWVYSASDVLNARLDARVDTMINVCLEEQHVNDSVEEAMKISQGRTLS